MTRSAMRGMRPYGGRARDGDGPGRDLVASRRPGLLEQCAAVSVGS